MTRGGQNQEDPSILSALNRQDATSRRHQTSQNSFNLHQLSLNWLIYWIQCKDMDQRFWWSLQEVEHVLGFRVSSSDLETCCIWIKRCCKTSGHRLRLWPEGQDGDEDGLLVDVPAEHEGAQSAEQQAAQETPSTARTPPDGRRRRLWRETEEKTTSQWARSSETSELIHFIKQYFK